MFINIVSDLE